MLSVGALDAYIHDKISENIVRYIRNAAAKNANEKLTPLNEILISKKIPPIDLVLLATRRRPFVQVRRYIDEHIFEQTFQHPGSIEKAMKLIGVPDLWTNVATAQNRILDPALRESREAICRDLASFAKRRNQIVHEGDRERSRTRKHKRRKISAKEVSRVLTRIFILVKAIDSLCKV